MLVSVETADRELFLDTGQRPRSFGLSGPRARLFFDPATTTCGIVTCGGLCPGVTDVIRSKDIGSFLRDEITRSLKTRGFDFSIKYIDPSYIIRSLPANTVDSEFCLILGQHAVHAGMAGYSDIVIGYWNHHFTRVPIALAVARRKQLDPQGPEWQSVLQATGQPASMLGVG